MSFALMRSKRDYIFKVYIYTKPFNIHFREWGNNKKFMFS